MAEDHKVISQYIIAFIANLTGFTFGIILGWSSIAARSIRSDININITTYKINEDQFSWVVAMMSLGGAISCTYVCWLRKKTGTKPLMLLYGAFCTIGWLLLIFSNHYWMFLIGRLFQGFAVGAYCNFVPLYIGEIASKQIRGVLLASFQLSVTFGTFFVYTLGSKTSLLVTNIICCAIVVAQTIGFIFCPESPIFLISKNKTHEAKCSIMKLRGENYNSKLEIEALQAQVDMSIKENKSFKEIIADKAIQRATIIMVGLMFFFQTTGINGILFYATDIFAKAKSSIAKETATIILGLLKIIGSFLSLFIIDRFGRKILLLSGSVMMTISLLVMALYFQFITQITTEFGFVPMLAIGTFVLFFSIGLGPMAYVFLGELFSIQAKVFAAPLGQTLNFLLSFVIAKIVVVVEESLGYEWVFYLFAGFAAASIFFMIFVVKETKGKSLAQIQEMLRK